MNSNTISTVVAASTGAAVGGVKLVFVGACLSLGFSLTSLVVRKTADAYTTWKYSRLEKKHPEPEEEA